MANRVRIDLVKRVRVTGVLAGGLLTGTLLAGGCAMQQAIPSSDQAYVQGALARDRGDLAQALADLSQAIEKNPKLTLAFMARGQVFRQQGHNAQAADD
jgi:Tfp pilus assembly protein PilF